MKELVWTIYAAGKRTLRRQTTYWGLFKNASEFNVKVMNGPSNNEGYVYYFEKPLGWLEHYYLNPIPLNQLALNPALEQNSGWENNK